MDERYTQRRVNGKGLEETSLKCSRFSIYKFTTYLYVVEVTGKELKDYMEWAASAYNQWKSGDISISFTMDIPGYQHEFFFGSKRRLLAI